MLRTFFAKRWFLFALAGVLTLGIYFAPQWQVLTRYREARYAVVACVLFLMSLPLEARHVWNSLRRPVAPLLATAVNFGLLPLVAWAAAQLLREEMRLGVYVAAATPATLASASVWTRRAGGNDAVAILVTVITNLSCFLMTPLWLWITTGQDVENESLQLSTMVPKLGLLVVLPMTLGQIVRRVGSVGAWAGRNKTPLGVLAQCGVLTMILFGAVQTGLRIRGGGAPGFAGQVALMAAIVMFVHISMLVSGMQLGRLAGLKREDRIAVGFAGSQKTLMVGLQTGMELHFSILPIVVYHVGQLVVDTLIADRLRLAAPPDP